MADPTDTGVTPDRWAGEHHGRAAALVEVVQAAGRLTLEHFRHADLRVEAKPDDSPVTAADRQAETLVRERLAERFPHDTLQGEEFAEQEGTSDYRWIVDPIDGTKSFICGVPLYSTLLALEFRQRPVAGAIFIPAAGELVVAAEGLGCWFRGSSDAPWDRCRVSPRTELRQAVFVTSQVDGFDHRDAGQAYKRLEAATRITRTWGDGYGYLMVATGRADLMIDPACKAWDVAAILPVIEEAGGRFTSWQGEATVRGGDGVGSNGHLHQAALEILAAGD